MTCTISHLHRITSGFHGAFAMGVAYQQGTLTLPDTWFRPPILGLASAHIVDTKFLELAMSLLDFSPRIPLGTFSILPFGLRPNKEHYMVPELSKDISDSRLMHDCRTNRCSDSADGLECCELARTMEEIPFTC